MLNHLFFLDSILIYFYLFSALPRHVTGRGCSTKDKVFYKECETHQSDQVEIMCFCSYFLCNTSSNPTKTGPKNVFTLVWFIILVAVLNKVLNTIYCTQYHVCQTTLRRKKNSKKDKKLLVYNSKKQICENQGKTNQNENSIPKQGMFDRWMHGKNCENSSSSDIIIISEYFNEGNFILQEKDEWPETHHLLNHIISSKEFPGLFLNEYQQLIKQAQTNCHKTLKRQYCAEVKDSPLDSKYDLFEDESNSSCLHFRGRKMETSPLFMPKHSALEPVTMTRTGS